MKNTSVKASLVFIFVSILGGSLMAQREYGGIHTKETLENVRKNALSHDATREIRQRVERNAQPWVQKSYEELWSMIPGQDLPRCIDVTWDYNYPKNPKLGCLGCGDEIHKIGGYPYEPDFVNKPWKLTCPNCNIVFPTNDFGAYYKSGIDEHGLFNPEKADKSLLFNVDHPDPSDPLHKFGVDDGFGYIDKNGRAHKFIGYYTWKYWRHVLDIISTLSDAYYYTGEKAYAHKAAVMIDRLADVYPAMDWNKYAEMGWYHSDGSSRKGKIEGRIWETFQVTRMARSYDKIISGTVDAPELYAFLKKKDTEFDLPGNKGTREDFVRNVDTGYLQTAAEALISGQVAGNQGMHQASMACVALALNSEPKTSEYLDWIFAADGGRLPSMLVTLFDRDGMADEAGPGYCYIWPAKIVDILNVLEPYEAYTNNRITRDYPFAVNMFRAPGRVAVLNTFQPNIGDSGTAGGLTDSPSANVMAAGFRYYDDIISGYNAFKTNDNSTSGLLVDATAITPDHYNQLLAERVASYKPEPNLGENLAGYGLASIEFGEDKTGKALWMYYGRNIHHGHEDRLNFSIYAFGVDLAPELGYPEMMNQVHRHTKDWNNNTISHNTVIVDDQKQLGNWTGYPKFFTVAPGFGAVQVESANVYKQAEQYDRTMSFIETPDGNAYGVDIFRVAGGKSHLLSFHGPAGPVTSNGLAFERQTSGTYAGENVPYGDNAKTHPAGYSYLKDVEWNRTPASQFSLDWKAQAGYHAVTEKDDIHMRMHFVGDLNNVALADGIPAQNKKGNPEKIRYALLRREAEGDAKLKSQFVSVLEPWKDKSFIEKIERVAVADPEAVAVKVTLVGGATDYVISNPSRAALAIEGGPSTDGTFAWLRVQDGRVTSASLTQGKELVMGETRITGAGTVAGELVRFERDPKKPAVAWVKVQEGDLAPVAGEQIIFANDKKRNACYDIVSVERDGDLWKVTCGPGTFVRGFADEKNYTKGYEYNVADGQKFVVPVTQHYSSAN